VIRRTIFLASALILCVLTAALSDAQILSERGFVEPRGLFFPQDAPNDNVNLIGDVLVRQELFLKPSPWLQFAAGADLRANSHDQVADSWRPDVEDRGILRPRIAVRRLSMTVARGPVTIDAGKQFIRWGTTDILAPTDHFAPRDYVDVVNNEFLPVAGARLVLQRRSDSLDGVWIPRLTPSRIPLINQRWAPPPPQGVMLVDLGQSIPTRSQAGVRWAHNGAGYEFSLSFVDGFNHLPNITPSVTAGSTPLPPTEVGVVREYPTLRAYGADLAIPTALFTIKAEAGYSTTTTAGTDEYVLYAVQLERQTGELLLLGGYIGEVVTEKGGAISFAPDRGLAKSIVARASYTIDTHRSVAVEGAVRQTFHGIYVKGEYSQAGGQHWRTTTTGTFIGGRQDDFFGQYDHNSNLNVALRFSF
jgi:hypothetical protein